MSAQALEPATSQVRRRAESAAAGVLATLSFALLGLAVLWPAVALALDAAHAPRVADADAIPGVRSAGALFAVTSAWALATALLATLLGWAPGRWLGRALGTRSFAPLAALALLPIAMPSYVVFYAWWQSWPADSALFAWAARHQLVGPMREATLLLGLVSWSWPLVAWSVAGAAPAIAAGEDERLALDGAGVFRAWLVRARTDAPGLALGALVVFLITFNNTTSFDLAQVFTFGNELRARAALGAGPIALVRDALPAIALAALGALAVWRLLPAPPGRSAFGAPRPGRATRAVAVAVWVPSVLIPAILLATSLRGRGASWGEFASLYGPGLATSVLLSLVSGLLSIVVALGLVAAWLSPRPALRALGHVQAILWLVAGLAPATFIAAALEAAYNLSPERSWLDAAGAAIFRGHLVLNLGHLASFGVVAALFARWLVAGEPRLLAELRSLDGGAGLVRAARAGAPRFVALLGAAAAITAVLALGEISVTASVHPPGSDPLAVTLLNAMHYQRPETVALALLVILAAALAVAIIVALLAVRAHVPMRRVTPIALLAAATILGACSSAEPETEALDTERIFGSPGISLGQFNYPRSIDVDARTKRLFVVDKSARVQRFSLDGEPELDWRMPEWENGKPTGLSVAPDGRIFVADTHYHRVIAYDADGRETMRFGRYGEGPGEFIYPTDVAFGSDGRLYVSEYGGNDRVQVFTAEGEFLFAFGSFGRGAGQFDRPQSIAFGARTAEGDGTAELFVADACNHRIVVVDGEGRERRAFGRPGTGAGEMHYPYGLAVLDDGSILVAEFGNSRLQRFSRDGRSLGLFGRLGAGSGELRYPWGVAAAQGELFVLDSGNNRVQVVQQP